MTTVAVPATPPTRPFTADLAWLLLLPAPGRVGVTGSNTGSSTGFPHARASVDNHTRRLTPPVALTPSRTTVRLSSKQHRRAGNRRLRRGRCHGLVTTRCGFGEMTGDGLRRFLLVGPVRESLRYSRIQPMSPATPTRGNGRCPNKSHATRPVMKVVAMARLAMTTRRARRKTGRPSCPRWQQWDVGKYRRRSWGYRLFADAQTHRGVGGETAHHIGCVVDEAATVPRCEPEHGGCSHRVGQHIWQQAVGDSLGVRRGIACSAGRRDGRGDGGSCGSTCRRCQRRWPVIRR